MNKRWWLYVVLAIPVAQFVAALAVHLGTFGWADVPTWVANIGNFIMVVLLLIWVVALYRLSPVPRTAGPAPHLWTSIRHWPRWLQLAGLVVPLGVVYQISMILLNGNMEGALPAATRLADLRISSA